MGIQVSGRLHAIFETKQVTERFTKREFVLEINDGKFPQYVLFQMSGERCGALDDFAVGDEVQLDFSLRGREWTGRDGEVRYFNSLDVWTIERAGAGGGAGRERGAGGERERGGERSGGRGGPPRGNRAARGNEPPPLDDDLPF